MGKRRTLVTRRLYFGMDAERLCAASGRVLTRVIGLTPERALASEQHLRHDFGVNTVEAQVLVDEFVAEGLLQPRAGQQGAYFLTPRFVEVASARVVDPLPRVRAKALVARACDVAARLNADALQNPLEIAAVAVYGSYMSLDEELAELDLALVVRERVLQPRPRWRLHRRRMLSQPDGADELRTAFRALSSFVNVHLVTELRLVSRPFTVVYQQS